MATPPFTIRTSLKRALADTATPVGMYLRLRKKFPCTLLLESADYRAAENSFSYICVAPFAGVSLAKEGFLVELPNGEKERLSISGAHSLPATINNFISRFSVESTTQDHFDSPGVINGLFGYLSYDAVPFIEDIAFTGKSHAAEDIPLMRYQIFRYIIAINHFKDELYLLENTCAEDSITKPCDILDIATNGPIEEPRFTLQGEERSNLTDQEHIDLIEKCKTHIARGDVFQIVPSRKFVQGFSGDDFAAYRVLRSLNPSPYLFYYDYGSYHIFGSSPEAQIVVKDGKASIFPIAGTYKRTGSDTADTEAAKKLLDDPKESAEHVMLVDLARNDLSIHCHPVVVEKLREVQLYSHVIHLVSKVTGTLFPGKTSVEILTATFPAGTLTGAPKYKAMQLIDRYEPERRHFYGGGLGFIGFNGDLNHAITIRTFLSRNNLLISQAGSGIVADSVPESEVAEVRNKLGALKAAAARASKEYT